MRYSPVFLSSSHLMSIIASIAEQPYNTTKLSEFLKHPRPHLRSLAFTPPPKWAAELSRRLNKQFSDLCQKNPVLYMRAFIHPSFTAPDAVSSTMNATASLGESLLLSVGGRLVVNSFRELDREEIRLLMSYLLSDSTLSSVLRYSWEMEDMVLTDSSIQLFQGKSLGTTAGLLQWLLANGKQQLPDHYCAECVKSMAGAVYLDEGLEASTVFIRKHILQALH